VITTKQFASPKMDVGASGTKRRRTAKGGRVKQTFPQFVLATYGKSVYQIELEVACALFVANDGPGPSPQDAAKRAWEHARIFVESMKYNYEAG
jgi:hypothetical protein